MASIGRPSVFADIVGGRALEGQIVEGLLALD